MFYFHLICICDEFVLDYSHHLSPLSLSLSLFLILVSFQPLPLSPLLHFSKHKPLNIRILQIWNILLPFILFINSLIGLLCILGKMKSPVVLQFDPHLIIDFTQDGSQVDSPEGKWRVQLDHEEVFNKTTNKTVEMMSRPQKVDMRWASLCQIILYTVPASEPTTTP